MPFFFSEVPREHASICQWHFQSIATITIKVSKSKLYSVTLYKFWFHFQQSVQSWSKRSLLEFPLYYGLAIVRIWPFDMSFLNKTNFELTYWYFPCCCVDAQTLLEYLPHLQSQLSVGEEEVAFLRRFLRRKEVQATMKVRLGTTCRYESN